MITAEFSKLIASQMDEENLIDKIYQYLTIMQLRDPKNPRFKNEFSSFYQLNASSYWGKAANKISFFNIFEKCFVDAQKQILSYSEVINRFGGRNEKSFSSKILHTIYPDKPIIDQRMLSKFEKDSEFSAKYSAPLLKTVAGSKGKPQIKVGGNTIDDSIVFYKNVENYYQKIIAYNKQRSNSKESYIGCGRFSTREENYTYFENFDIWALEKSVPIHFLSLEKKLDLYLWLA